MQHSHNHFGSTLTEISFLILEYQREVAAHDHMNTDASGALRNVRDHGKPVREPTPGAAGFINPHLFVEAEVTN